MPPRRRVATAISQAPGSAKSAYHSMPSIRWPLEMWPSSCASTVFTSSSVKLPSRIVFQKTIRLLGP